MQAEILILSKLASEAAASEVTAAPTRLITNCRVLGEGVDLPAVDLVVIADAKQRCVQESAALLARPAPEGERVARLVAEGRIRQ